MPELFEVCTVDEALGRLLPHIGPLERVETVPLREALGRVLADDVPAPGDLPSFLRSTMDGFAVRAADTFGASEGLPAYLTVVGEAPMGRAPSVRVGVGEAALIHTGGMIPEGADAVVMVEHTQTVDARTIEVVRPAARGEHTIPPGEDMRRGALLLSAGRRLRPQDVGALAASGITRVAVRERPRVAIIATGDEVVAPDVEPGPGQVRDINSTTAAALTERAGGLPCLWGIVPDRREALEQAARAALDAADLLVISAGSSVSTRDLTAAVIAGLGEPGVLVHGVSIHPGKPTILAMAGGKPVIGLPGNPVSAMIVFDLFAGPALAALLGAPPTGILPQVTARLTQHIPSTAGREDFVPVRLAQDAGGGWEATPVFGKSNLITTLTQADGLVRVPLDLGGLYAGTQAAVRLF